MYTNKKFEIHFTSTLYKRLNAIYDYILEELHSPQAAKKLMRNLEEKIISLKDMPFMYPQIEKIDKDLQRQYRKLTVENYIILYIVDEKNKIIYISNMYHSDQDYLKYN